MTLTASQEERISRMEKQYGTKRKIKWGVWYRDPRVDDGGFEDWVASFDTYEEAVERMNKEKKWCPRCDWWVEEEVVVPCK